MLQDQVNKLEDNVSKLNTRDQSFANSLIKTYRNKGALSPKQAPWIQKLTDRALGTPVVQTPRETEQVGSFDGLIGMFNKAKQHLKYPAISLLLDSGPVRMFMGTRGAGKGCVNVTDGGSYNNNKWYGRVSTDGTWTKGRAFAETPNVRQLLLDMSVNPAATAQAYGRLTGKCCFCNHGLKDEKSTEVGYGPICAEHFGLPWGNKRRGL